MYILELTDKEVVTLIKLLSEKAKEIHAWRCTTNSRVRDKDYDNVTSILKSITYRKES